MKKLLQNLLYFNNSMTVAISFAALIFLGTLLLMLPCSNMSGQWMPFMDALFTATSAACVTGLAVVDTGHYFSLFGHTVLILLIQVGGLGIMTLTTLFSIGIGKRINIKERMLIQQSLNQHDLSGVLRMVIRIVKYTLIIEFVFGSILAWHFYDDMGLQGLYWGYWHAVSAFCNAGFDLFGNFTSLTVYADNLMINLSFILLIVLGGIGFTVMGDIANKRSWKKFSLHTKIVLSFNVLLIFGGALGFWLLEMHNPATMGGMNMGDGLLAALFQSVSSRTAGFNTVDIAALTNASLLLMMLLMFIGASPTSTGGGIKTTTFVVLLASTLALLRGKKDVVLFRRRIDSPIIAQCNSIFLLSLLWLGLALFLLLALDTGNHPFNKVVFELFSAFGTVGMGIGITSEWNNWCKSILIVTMFIGRVGILTFGMSFFNRKIDKIRYPYENIITG